MKRELLRKLPKVDELLKRNSLTDLVDRLPRQLVLDVIRDVLDEHRRALIAGDHDASLVAVERIERAVEHGVAQRLNPELTQVINATGVVLHTNLGRAPLGSEFLSEAAELAAGYSNLEYDVANRKRGSRYTHTADLLKQLTGAEASIVVNNNAAAMVVMLGALASGREAIVSRGELIEIGGSFRLPEIFEAGGVILREVGTTNRTHLKDYQKAICDETAMLLKVHRSNFAIVGFTKEVSAEELVALGHEHSVPVCEDLGSGCLVDLSSWGIDSAIASQQVSRGLDLVTFSGDKLLGGPQAGIIVGRHDLIEKIKKHPLTRALRVDKLTLATLERTLLAYVDGTWKERIPALKMLTLANDVLKDNAERLAQAFRDKLSDSATVTVEPCIGRVGGGALPEVKLHSWAVRVRPSNRSAVKIEAGLRNATIPIVCRIDDEALVFDVRTLFESETGVLSESVRSAIID